jgi:hypothetical protein
MLILAWVFFILASLLVVAQIACVLGTSNTGKGTSFVLIPSALFCLFAWLLGREHFGLLAFLPAILDPISWIFLAWPFILIARWRKAR